METLINQAPVALYTCAASAGYPISYVSAYVNDLMGYRPEELLDKPHFLFEHIHPLDRTAVLHTLQNLQPGQLKLRKYRFKMKNGQWKWLRDRTKLIVNETGQAIEIIGAWTDISELIQIEEALRISEAKHRFLLEHINVGVLLFSADGKIAYANPQAAQLLGHAEQHLLTLDKDQFENLFLDENGTPLSHWQRPISQVLSSGLPLENQVVSSQDHHQQTSRWLAINTFPQQDELQTIIVTLLDISERIKAQQEIHHLAHYDPLTRLPNRFLINLHIEQALQHAHQEHKQFALLFLDLDDFKLVNDTLGHHAGDELLNQIAERLRNCLGEFDKVGRLGGDEFMILLHNAAPSTAAHTARNIINCFQASFQISGHQINSRPSIGISLYPDDGTDAITLSKRADIAMYHAKEAKRGDYQFFEEQMLSKIEQRAQIERDLQLALQEQQFLLYYQPQIDSNSGKIVGVEALIRWLHPQQGMIAPQDFIPIAEQSQQIISIGLWVFRRACQDLKNWQQQALLPNIKVSINLSFRQLQTPGLIHQIKDIIAETGVAPEALELELTETIMMENHRIALDFMKQCRQIGIQFSIDDFGTGYSSLSYLTKLPLSKIKIDRAFVRDIVHDPDANTIISAIVSMAQSLRLTVVAEGAETLAQITQLKNCGCNIIQGYYYSLPLNYADITQLLRQNQ